MPRPLSELLRIAADALRDRGEAALARELDDAAVPQIVQVYTDGVSVYRNEVSGDVNEIHDHRYVDSWGRILRYDPGVASPDPELRRPGGFIVVHHRGELPS